ncbi:hypothetical protein CTRI78_v008776 [Colletotrichum trifolii]|uniref:Uncharacterized protein n=1 Tax=Colletotrichum trifolii TaxID=5466 RepID=A0A4R8QSH0_COLTR|nr:hypothetical protein CTRI78_v008776 [Colletotrichum trifolii]
MRAEPDIGGKGVIASFVITASLTLITTLFCLTVGRTNEDRQTFNPIDRLVRKHISEPARTLLFRLHLNPDVQALVAYDLVNTFSDLQLVTGMAVLVGGLKQLQDGTLSTYHFMIVTDLAWFCTGTHLFSLQVVTSMRDSVKRTHPARYHHHHHHEQEEEEEEGEGGHGAMAARMARAVRILFMAATFVLLVCAFWVAGYEGVYREGAYRCPMKCSLDQPRGGRAMWLMVVNMVMMSYYYALSIFRSWRTARVFWMDSVRGRLIDRRGQSVNVLDPAAVFSKWRENVVLRWCRKCLLGVWYLFASEVQTVLGLLLYFAFGLWSLIDDRELGHLDMEDDERHEENSYSLSQLVPIFLLLIPFMGVFESYARHSRADRERKTKEVD